MSEHIVPVRTYINVFVALMVLFGMTVAAARIEHGVLNLVVGLSIAIAKAALIVLFFMHIKYNKLVVRMAALSGVLWFALLMTFTMADYLTRS